MPGWWRNTGSSASPNCRWRSISPPSSATARRRWRTGDLAIFISQSGETADTLASLRYAKEHKQHVLSVVNVPTSTIARESDVVMPTLAGPEIGVASTKAFTCQLAVLACLAIAAGRARGELSDADEQKLVHALIEVPRLMTQALALEPQIERLAHELAKVRDVLYLGRGTSVSDRAGRRAEAEGNLLYPRRRLCRRRAQARADRADRRDHAGDRDRAARPRVREDAVEHGGGGRARRPHHPGDRSEGRQGSRHGPGGDADAARHGGDGDAAGLCAAGATASPIIPRSRSAPTSTSRATSRNRSRWNRIAHGRARTATGRRTGAPTWRPCTRLRRPASPAASATGSSPAWWWRGRWRSPSG